MLRSLTVFVLSLTVALAACDFEQVIELDVPPYEPRLVLGGFPTPDSVFAVRVGRSASTLDPRTVDDDLLLSTARVVLFADGAFLDSLHYVGPTTQGDYYEVPGYYSSVRGLHPEAGRTYTLRVEAPGFPPAEATTTLPTPPTFTAAFEGFGAPNPQGRPARLAVALDDPPGDQTYGLSVSGRTTLDGAPYVRAYPFLSAEPAFRESLGDIDEAIAVDFFDVGFEPGNGLRAFSRTYFRDDLFAGTAFAFDLDVLLFGDAEGQTQLTVTVASLDEDYARYQQTIALQSQTEGNPFSEPVRIHSNVEGGLGVFAGYTSSSVVVDIE